MNEEYLFPQRLTRRDFVKLSTAAAAAIVLPTAARAEEKTPVKFGEGAWSYTLDESWGQLPEGMNYGHGCGIVVDDADRIYVTTRSQSPCVAVFDPKGTLLETWSKEFAEDVGMDTEQVAATAHCIYRSKEGGQEFFYFTENVAGGKDGKPRIGARVYKTDLKGKVLYTLGNVEKERDTSQKFDFTNPTDVAVGVNGDIYIVDGYGSQRVSRFDQNFKHLQTFGTRGKGQDQFNTCHGVWVSTLNAEPEVYIADRWNGRYQVYSPEFEFKRSIIGDFIRNPCCFYQHAGHLYIPDLASMVTIINAKDEPVAKLGDGKSIPKGGMKASPELAAQHPDKFFAPHALTVDSQGNIYVLEWLPFGRVRKLTHTPA